LTACDGDPAGPDPQLSQEEVSEVAATLGDQSLTTMEAAESDASSSLASASAASATSRPAPSARLTPAAVVINDEISFERTRDCAGGGEVRVDGQIARVWDSETRELQVELQSRKVHDECAVVTPRRVVVLNGSPDLELQGERLRVEGQLSGLQTATLEGAVDWRVRDGEASGTCRVDLEITFDPEAVTRTVTGTVCNTTVERSRTWSTSG
jgi:hypothetical protein